MTHSASNALPPRIRILVAESEEVMVRTLATILDLGGYEVCALYTGEDTLRLLNLLHAQVDVVDLSSRTPAEELQLLHPLSLQRCRILLFTGQTGLYELLHGDKLLTLPFELLVCPIRTADLLAKLKHGFCSKYPPLVVPFDTTEALIH